jgi:hypothetical protein
VVVVVAMATTGLLLPDEAGERSWVTATEIGRCRWLWLRRWERRHMQSANDLVAASSPFTLIRGDGYLQPDPGGIAMAARHHLDLLLFEQLLRQQGLPGSVRREAERVLQAADNDNSRLLDELIRVQARLFDSGIPSLPLKGPVLALQLWGDLRLRRSLDIDLLVSQQQVPEAVRVLERAGYRVPPPAGGLIREIHLEHEAEPFILDLHWNVAPGEIPFPLAFEEIWADRRQMPRGHTSIPVIGPEWLLVLLCLYLVKDYPWPRLIYLCDLARLIVRFSDLDWDRVTAIAMRTGTRRICALGVALVDSLPGAAVPARAMRLLAADVAVLAAARRMKRAVASVRDEDAHDDPTCRIRKIMSHPAFRERPRDKLRVLASLVPLTCRPARTHADQGWGNASLCRIRRLISRTARLPASLWAKAFDDVRPVPGTAFFPIDNCGLLLTATGHELYALSPSAAALWCWLEEGLSPAKIERRFAVATGFARPQVRGMITSALSQWRNFGLLGARQVAEPRQMISECDAPAVSGSPVAGPLGWPRRYKVLDTIFEVQFSSQWLAEATDTALGHLAATSRPTASASLSCGEDGILIAIDDRVVDQCADLDEVAPTAKGALTIEAVNRQGFGLFLHAAMVHKEGKALLLPAPPGSGKTCLSAALAKAGFSYCSDEMTLLDGETWRARGLPTALAVKEGAWELLRPLYPELSTLRAHRRADGRIVKYLPPPISASGPPPDAPVPVRAIVLPHYVPGAVGELVTVGRADALQCLMTECVAMRMALTATQVRKMIRWVEAIDCYTLRFGNLAAATDLLGKIPLKPSN